MFSQPLKQLASVALMVYLRRKVEIPSGIGCGSGYYLLLRDSLKETQAPDGSVFITEYDICRKLTNARYIAETGREFGKPLTLTPEASETNMEPVPPPFCFFQIYFESDKNPLCK